jgi:tellurite methyltransferase
LRDLFSMPMTREEWDERHRRKADGHADEPSTILKELLPLLPAGPALDLACGAGRNALYLVRQTGAQQRGVTAVDRSQVALESIERHAKDGRIDISRGTRIVPTAKGLHLVAADLAHADMPLGAFSLIVCIRYLERRTFRGMAAALSPGGMLLFETYTKIQLEFADGPKNPEYLLDTGELGTAFPELETVFYRELRAGQGLASLLARKRAVAQSRFSEFDSF